jgi:hypothetical protein
MLTSQATISLKNVKIKTGVTFTYNKSLVEYTASGFPIEYDNSTTYDGVISALTNACVANERRIDVIKSLRADNEGLSLKDAKDIAEMMISHYQLSNPKTVNVTVAVGKPLDWKADVSERFKDRLGNRTFGTNYDGISYPSDDLLTPATKIEYIRVLRDMNGIYLKDAKDIADYIWSILDL